MSAWTRFRAWKHSDPVLVAGALSFVFALALLFASNGPNEPPAYQHAKHVPQPVSAEERIADYTLALTLFTGVLAISTIGLWLSTRRLWKHAESIESASLYITVDAEAVMPGQVRLDVAVGNGGRTPAIIVEENIDYIPLAEAAALHEEAPNYKDENRLRAAWSVPPNQEVPIVAIPADVEHRVLIGYLKYIDHAGAEWIQRFCWAVDGELLAEVPPRVNVVPFGERAWNAREKLKRAQRGGDHS